MPAELLFHQRIDYEDGGIVEMVLWRVPSPVPPSKHGLKYSVYAFSTVEKLLSDFWSDVRVLRDGK
jgi:hypothetical protein